MAKQQDDIMPRSDEKLEIRAKIQEAKAILKAVQSVDILLICNELSVSQDVQTKFIDKFNTIPNIENMSKVKKFFEKQKNNYKNIDKYLSILKLCDNSDADLLKILKIAGTSEEILCLLNNCNQIDEALKILENMASKYPIFRLPISQDKSSSSYSGIEKDSNVLAHQKLGAGDNTSPLVMKSEFKLNSVDQQAPNLQSSLSNSGFENNNSNLLLLGEQSDFLKEQC